MSEAEVEKKGYGSPIALIIIGVILNIVGRLITVIIGSFLNFVGLIFIIIGIILIIVRARG